MAWQEVVSLGMVPTYINDEFSERDYVFGIRERKMSYMIKKSSRKIKINREIARLCDRRHTFIPKWQHLLS